MKVIQFLRQIVERNCISADGKVTTLAYWSDVVFAKSVFVLAPFSLLAIIPAIIICLQTKVYSILWFDLSCFVMLLIIGYAPGISVKIRKIILISSLFLAAFVLMAELGNFGPGLVYLLTVTIFSLLLFPGKKTAFPFVFTLIFSLFYGFLIHFGYIELQSIHNSSLMEWIAVSSNVLFLSAIFSLIIPFFFSKLENVLEEKSQLLESVRKANAELKKSIENVNSKNVELEQFAYTASHNLQEPLRMVSSFMDQLKRKYENQLDEKAHQYIHYAVDGAKRMKRIISDLLEYSRAGKFIDGIEEVDLYEIIENYQILRRNIINEKSVKIITSEFPKIATYKAPLTQTLHCLIDNAIHYSKKEVSPVIKIQIKDLSNHWQIEVEDNGIGIEAQFYNKIFIIFQRLHNKGLYEGTGIGLSVVKKHVESWGGKIGVASVLGVGSKFYFTIPKN